MTDETQEQQITAVGNENERKLPRSEESVPTQRSPQIEQNPGESFQPC